MGMEVTQALAERIAEVARLLKDDTGDDAALRRLADLGVELVPGAVAAGVLITAAGQGRSYAASDPRVDELHALQFAAGKGPVVETLRHNEARHVRDAATEDRWPDFCQAAIEAGFASMIALPLHTHQQPAGAVALYAAGPGAFSGVAHDIALLFAAQGATAVYNAERYGSCRQMADNLQVALEARAVIEQAKGVIHAKLDVPTEDAFEMIRRFSQNTNQKARVVAERLVAGELDPGQLRGAGS